MSGLNILMNQFKGKARTRAQQIESLTHPGRRMGLVHGSYITDMAENQQSILLCLGCQHRFDPKAYGYYRTKEFSIQGPCDACKDHAEDAIFFIHESLVGDRHGQCWEAK